MQDENIQTDGSGTWKDRGWWMSVDIIRQRSAKKKYDEALDLQGLGERYDLILDNGKVLARGVFTPANDLNQLAKLLLMIEKWSGTEIHIRGKRIDCSKCWSMAQIFRCCAGMAPCQCESAEKHLTYIGCHKVKYPISLLHYLPNLNLKERYWFEFYEKARDDVYEPYYLDKKALKQAVESANDGLSLHCPRFPAQSLSLIDLLPVKVDFRRGDARWWRLERSRKKNRNQQQKKIIVPRSPEIYRRWICQWLRSVLSHDKDARSEDMSAIHHAHPWHADVERN